MRKYALLFLFCLIPLKLISAGPILPWIVYYNDKAPPEAFLPYNPIILDSEHHPQIDILLKEKRIVLGYFSIGEAADRHSWFQEIKDMNILIEENPNFAGSWSVDIRASLWTDFVLNRIIPNLLQQGFSGIFIDQVDIALALEQRIPAKYQGMAEAAIALIKAIRRQFPGIYIMLNRGYEILPKVGGDIDFELAETLYTSYDFSSKHYYVRSKNEFEWQLSLLNKARFMNPTLTLFSLDYWDPKDQSMIEKIYAIEREQQMRPYVTSIVLDEITKEKP